MKKQVFLLLSLFTLLLNGCGESVKPTVETWQTIEQSNQVTWADDDSDVAVVVMQFEENDSGEQRNFQHKLFVQSIDSEQRQAITEWREHHNGNVYYMKQAGYFIVESILESGARQFDKIDNKGKEILIVETADNAHQVCDETSEKPAKIYHTVMPSPDGKKIANIYSPNCGQVAIEFLYANNLNIIEHQDIDVDIPVSAMWHQDDYIMIIANDLSKAWKVMINKTAETIPSPQCLAPTTTSSRISAKGQLVYFSNEDTNTLAVKDVGQEAAFPCYEY